MFRALLERASPEGKIVVDVGCGTGRHWKTLRAHRPAAALGYDVVPGDAEPLLARSIPTRLSAIARPIIALHTELPDESCDRSSRHLLSAPARIKTQC